MPGDAVELRPYAASDLDRLSRASAQVGACEGAARRAGELEPQISQIGELGIPIRHELELEKVL